MHPIVTEKPHWGVSIKFNMYVCMYSANSIRDNIEYLRPRSAICVPRITTTTTTTTTTTKEEKTNKQTNRENKVVTSYRCITENTAFLFPSLAGKIILHLKAISNTQSTLANVLKLFEAT